MLLPQSCNSYFFKDYSDPLYFGCILYEMCCPAFGEAGKVYAQEDAAFVQLLICMFDAGSTTIISLNDRHSCNRRW